MVGTGAWKRHLNVDVDGQIDTMLREVAPKRLHGLLAGLDVHEYTLQFACELVPTLGLELAEHGMFCIVVCDATHQQPLTQMLLVVPLEQVLVLQVPARWRRCLWRSGCAIRAIVDATIFPARYSV